MKVALISPVFPYPKKGIYVGIERHVYEYSKALLKKGHEVTVITTFWNGGKNREESEGVNIYRTPDISLKFGRLGRLFDLHVITFSKNILNYERLLRSLDVVHALMPLSSVKFFMDNSIPLVSHFYHRDEITSLKDYLYIPFGHYLEKKSYSLSNVVISPSESSKKVLVDEYSLPEDTIRVVPFGVNTATLNLEASKTLKNSDLKQRIILLFVGPLIPRKGVIYLIRALPKVIEKHKKILLMIVGEGIQKQSLINETERLNINKYVKFTGYLDGWGGQLVQYYHSADVFVFPSFKEGFGMVLVEAMACSLPIISTNASAIPEVVGDAGILVEPRNSQALAEAIINLIENEELRKELGKKGMKRVEENFTWDIVAEKMLKIYEEAAK